MENVKVEENKVDNQNEKTKNFDWKKVGEMFYFIHF